MTKAYLILAHKYPGQLKRLIDSLTDGLSFFFVHIDRGSDITPFQQQLAGYDNLQFLPREKTDWGSQRIVSAILRGLEAVNASGHFFKHIVLLSGQDYPLKSNELLTQFTEEHADKSFLEYFHLPAPEKWQPNGGLYRVNKYYMGLKPWQRLCSRSLNFSARYLFFLRRRPYAGLEPYAGSMWWVLNRPAMEYILAFVKANPGYVNFHRFTFAADEVFFHTILLNAAPGELAATVVNSDKRFIKWKDRQAAHPEVLKKENLAELMASDALFARKFDEQQDAAVLDQLDQHRHANP